MAETGRFKKEYIEQAYKLRLLGATLKQVAEFFNITQTRLELWRKKHKEFEEALRDGAMIADADIAHSLYRRALGYSHPEDKVFHFQGDTVVHPVVKHYPPDTEAAKFWLRVRQRELWGTEGEGGEGGKDGKNKNNVKPLIINRTGKRA